MTKTYRKLTTAALLLWLCSFTTCFFGPLYVISKIPKERLARMSDKDWIGVEWIGGGMLLFLSGSVLALAALFQWFKQKRRGSSATMINARK
jgi:hypothetical protein